MKTNLHNMKTLFTRSIAMLWLIMGIAITSYAQTTTTESFDGAVFPPTGWTTSSSSSLSWSRVTTSSYPSALPHSGAGMALCNSYSYSSGTALLITPVIDYSLRGGNTPTVSFWMYRDNGYSSTADNVEVFVNTTNTTTGGTSLGVINRSRSLAPIVATDGWYQYSFNIPAPYAGSTNFLVFAGTSYYGNDILMDDVVYTSYPAVPGIVTGYVSNGFGVPIYAATVTIGTLTTTTAGNGSYTFISVPPGTYSMTASAPSFNSSTATGVLVTGGVTTYQNFTLHRPAIAVTPNPFNVTVNPNELYTENMTITNGGDGILDWTANVVYPGDNPQEDYPLLSGLIASRTNWIKPIIAEPSRMLATNPAPNAPLSSNSNRNPSDLAYAYVAYAGSSSLTEGPCSFALNQPGSIASFGGAASDFIATSEWVNDVWYGVIYGGTLITIDMTTGAFTTIGSTADMVGMSYDWTQNIMYGIDYNGILYTVDLATGTPTVVGNAGATGFIAFEIDNNGDAFAVNINSDQFGSINLTTGIWTSIAPVGFDASYAQDMTCDHSTNTIYWAAYDYSLGGELLIVDQATGTITFVGAFPGGAEITGFTVPNGPAAGGGWFTLDQYSGTVNPYINFSLPAHFNASGFNAGDVLTCEVTFTSSPDVGTVTIPVTMTVQGASLALPTDLTATLTNVLTGTVALNWSYVPSGTLINFIVKRDGVQIGTSLAYNFSDILPTYGVYSYTVQAVYAEGASSPAGPEEVEWANPTMVLNPTSLYDEIWVNHSAVQHLTVSNIGEGTLSFTFPEWAGDHLLKTPGIQHNNVSNPFEGMNVNFAKNEFDPTAGGGYPPVMGAGGPDPFGYIWIDSDEAGGPNYNWIDISATGTVVTGLTDDNNVGPYSIGWNFPFYGNNFNQFWINSNGTIGFNNTYIGLSNYAIPNTSYTNYIAWMWDDMDPGNANTHVYYKNMGTQFVIQFQNYYRYPDGGPYVDAEMILYADGHILIQYSNLAGGITTNSCSVGVQGPNSTDGLQVVYNANYMHNNLALWMGLPAPSFITAVVPAEGIVPSNGSQNVSITFDATGYDPGTYTEDLEINSNDLANAVVQIPCTMVVYVPGGIMGTVTDGVSGDPLPGVTVTAGLFSGTTGNDGTYEFTLDAGTYNVGFTKTGYQSVSVNNQVVVADDILTVDAQMYEEPYAPNTVVATVNDVDTQCEVVWNHPEGPYEILYDDGTAENFAAWAQPGNMNAVKFTPMGYPSSVTGGKFYVGDGSFPAGGTIMGAAFYAEVKDDNGPGGMPGTTIDSVLATVTNFGWVVVNGLNAEITSGNFYLVMVQGSAAPNCAPVGVDQTPPISNKSYSRNVGAGGAWALSPYQDLMMRAILVGPPSGGDAPVADIPVKLYPVKQSGMISLTSPLAFAGYEGKPNYAPSQGIETDALDHYEIWRLSDFDPNGPVSAGTFSQLPDATSTSYTDGGTVWAGLLPGWYAYGVAAVYPNGDVSDTVYSNIVGHRQLVSVTVNVSVCGGAIPTGAIVTLTGSDYPYQVYSDIVSTGPVVFSAVWKGHYTLLVQKGGYEDYMLTANITSNRVFDVVLEELKYKPRNLYVDDLTLVANWEEPLSIIVDENFEGGTFPPDGWQAITQGDGWFASTNGSSGAFPIPTHTTYAVSNDDANSSNNGCCDYLIMPPADLTGAPSYVLSFQSYYSGTWSQSAYVEMSTDAGATWTVINALNANPGGWTQIDIDLSAYSGPAGLSQVWFAFHADDNGAWASGWAVDDVKLSSGGIPILGYAIFLDGALVYQPIAETTYTFDPATINYGQTYEAGVASIYCSGFSELDTYRFTSRFLYPPTNLTGIGVDNAAFLDWEGPAGGGGGAGGSLTEDFELGITPDGWQIITTNTNIGGAGVPCTWTVTNYASADIIPFGTYHCGLWWDYSHQDEWLISPEIACGATTTLSFETSVYEGSTYLDHYYVKVSTDGGTTWDVVWDASTLTGNAWNYYAYPYSISLSAYAGQDIKIAWNAVDGDGQGLWYVWFVDNIAVASGDGMIRIPASALTHKGLSGNNTQRHDAIARDGNLTAIPGSEHSLRAPAGLIGYNLYRDNAAVPVAYIEAPTTEYWDLNLAPATYCYDVTAVYDLSAYGSAGTGESMKEGTACVDVNYGYPLPFIEEFETGLFSVNQWTAGDNWRIAGQMGNPMPSAEFGWDPPQTNYALSLESYYLNSVPMGSSTSIYKIFFDFDLALADRSATSNEKMAAEVWNGSSWVKVAEFVNNGDLDFTTQHIDITSKAKNRVFKVRFLASGDASTDIYYWLVDNIHVYYEFAPALNLVMTSVTTDPNNIHLSWEAPVGGGTITPGEWIHYDDGVNVDAIGTGAAADFNVAIRYTPSQLGNYDGWAVKKIKFFPNEAACSYSVRVWSGENAANLIVDQPIASPTIGEWNEIDLTDFASIDASQELWIGYRCNTTGGYPAGCDAGCSAPGYSDLITLDGILWESISQVYGLDYDWNIQAFVEELGDGKVASLQPMQNTLPTTVATGTLKLDPSYRATTANLAQRTTSCVIESDNSRALTSYNVYRKGSVGEYANIGTTEATTYDDLDLSLDCYYYYVTVVYTDIPGVNESMPSNIVDTCFYIGIRPITASSEVNIYPNPATTLVNIVLTDNVRQLTMYNYLGAIVEEKSIAKEKSIELNTSNFAAGAYTIRFTTANGETFSKKLVIIK
jgi:hypothetical protein